MPTMLLYLLLLPAGWLTYLLAARKHPEPGSTLAPVAASLDDAMLTAGIALCRVGHSVKWRTAEPGTVAGTCRRCDGTLLIADGPGEVSIEATPSLATADGVQNCPRTRAHVA
jgi:hypothetical protein